MLYIFGNNVRLRIWTAELHRIAIFRFQDEIAESVFWVVRKLPRKSLGKRSVQQAKNYGQDSENHIRMEPYGTPSQ